MPDPTTGRASLLEHNVRYVRLYRSRAQAPATLFGHWIAEGHPTGKVTLGSFEACSKVMGGILAAAGMEAFLANRDRG